MENGPLTKKNAVVKLIQIRTAKYPVEWKTSPAKRHKMILQVRKVVVKNAISITFLYAVVRKG